MSGGLRGQEGRRAGCRQLHVFAEFDVEAEASELGEGFASGSFGVFAVVVVAARVAVRLVVCEHVPYGGEDVVLEGDVRALPADPRGEPAVSRS